MGNIRPPRPTQKLQQEIEERTKQFKQDITRIMSTHLVNSARTAQETLEGLNNQDLGMAREIAEKQYKRRLGTKAHPEVVTQAYEELDGWVRPKKRPTEP